MNADAPKALTRAISSGLGYHLASSVRSSWRSPTALPKDPNYMTGRFKTEKYFQVLYDWRVDWEPKSQRPSKSPNFKIQFLEHTARNLVANTIKASFTSEKAKSEICHCLREIRFVFSCPARHTLCTILQITQEIHPFKGRGVSG